MADRLRERQEAVVEPTVECHRWLDRYWIVKELLWVVYFAGHGAWSALTGAAVFIAYPFWRRWYRRRRPITR